MRTKKAEAAEYFAQVLEIINAIADYQAKVDGKTRTHTTTFDDLMSSKSAFDDLDGIEPNLVATATPFMLAGFIAGLPRVGYRIVKA